MEEEKLEEFFHQLSLRSTQCSSTGSIPSYYFPEVAPLGDRKKREVFRSYGTPEHLNVSETEAGIEYTKQHATGCASIPLSARQPTLPLLPPNKGLPDPLYDPCMQEINDKNNSYIAMIRRLKQYRGVIRKNEEKVTKIKEFLDSCDPDKMNLRNLPLVKPFKKYVNQIQDKVLESPELPVVNSWYTGGCLGNLHLPGDGDILVYPSGPQLEYLNLTCVKTGERFYAEEPFFTRKQRGRIYETNTTVINNIGYVAFRCEDTCYMYSIQRDAYDNSISCSPVCHTYHNEGKHEMASVSPSFMIPGEMLVATRQKEVYLITAGSRTMECILPHIESRFECPEPWVQVHYAAHPRQAVIADRTGLMMLDFRMNPGNGSDIYVLPNKLFHLQERIMCTKPLDDGGFYHLLASDHQLILADARFPKHTVLQRNHMLETPPQYMEVLHRPNKLNTDDVVIIGSQSSREVVCQQIDRKTCRHPPTTTGAIWRLSRVDDVTRIQCLNEDLPSKKEVKVRLAIPLAGVTGIKHTDKEGFTVVQINAVGDTFYQSYYPDDDPNTDRTCSTSLGHNDITLVPEDVTRCQQWFSELHDLMQAHKTPITDQREESVFDASTSFEGIRGQVYPHLLCTLCSPSDEDADITEEQLDELCYACHNSLRTSRDISAIGKQSPVNEQEVSTTCGLPSWISNMDTSKFSDPQSVILHRMWNQHDPDLADCIQKLDEEVNNIIQDFKEKQKRKQEDASDTGSHDVSVADEDDDNNESSTILGSVSSEEGVSTPSKLIGSSPAKRRRHDSAASQSSTRTDISNLSGFLSTPTRIRKQLVTSDTIKDEVSASDADDDKLLSQDKSSLEDSFSMFKTPSQSTFLSTSQLTDSSQKPRKKKASFVMGF